MSYSDRQLRDFLAGRLARDTAERIEQSMLVDRDLERRIMALDDMAGEVRAAMKTVPNQGLLRQIEAGMAPKRRPWWAAVAAAVVVGFGAGWVLNDTPPEDWRAQVAQYQSLYVPETVTGTRFSEEALGAQMAASSARLGRSLDPEALASLGALELARAQILSVEGQPLIQIAYRGPEDAPFALCIMPAEGGERGLRSEALYGLATAAWSDGAFQYILVGGTDAGFVEDHARRAMAAL